MMKIFSLLAILSLVFGELNEEENIDIHENKDERVRRLLVSPSVVSSVEVTRTARDQSIIDSIYHYGVAIEVWNWYGGGTELTCLGYYIDPDGGHALMAPPYRIYSGKGDIAGVFSDRRDLRGDSSAGLVRYKIATTEYTQCMDIMWATHLDTGDRWWFGFGIGVSSDRCDVSFDEAFVDFTEEVLLDRYYDDQSYQVRDMAFQSRAFEGNLRWSNGEIDIAAIMSNEDEAELNVHARPDL